MEENQKITKKIAKEHNIRASVNKDNHCAFMKKRLNYSLL